MVDFLEDLANEMIEKKDCEFTAVSRQTLAKLALAEGEFFKLEVHCRFVEIYSQALRYDKFGAALQKKFNEQKRKTVKSIIDQLTQGRRIYSSIFYCDPQNLDMTLKEFGYRTTIDNLDDGIVEEESSRILENHYKMLDIRAPGNGTKPLLRRLLKHKKGKTKIRLTPLMKHCFLDGLIAQAPKKINGSARDAYDRFDRFLFTDAAQAGAGSGSHTAALPRQDGHIYGPMKRVLPR